VKTIATIILSLSAIFSYIHSGYSDSQSDLLDIAEVAEKNGVTIKAWTVYSRESIGHVSSKEEMNARFDAIMNDRQAFSWVKEKEQVDHHYVTTGTKVDANGITQRIVVTAYQTGGVFELNVSHEFSGEKWDEETLHFFESQDFDGETFYTIRGTTEKKASGLSEQARDIMSDFKGTEVEGLHEPSFVSLSAYSDKLETSVMTREHEKMNLQIGLRTMSADEYVGVTIGTPIITTEY